MKVVKRSSQRNVKLEKGFYCCGDSFANSTCKEEINKLFENGTLFKMEDDLDEAGYQNYRVSLSHAKEIKVVYSKEYGYYMNVVVLKEEYNTPHYEELVVEL